MKPLDLPQELKGPWENLILLSFGADLPFFENAVWKYLPKGCRRRVLLADGARYTEACNLYTRDGFLRHANQRYAVGGVQHPHAVHAKALMLTNEERGRLLVGSGNLSRQGYASGGELFTQYHYSPEAPNSLAAFHRVRDLVTELTRPEKALPLLQEYTQRIFAATPWLATQDTSDIQPVRHNLSESFIDQLVAEARGEPVEELWLLCPYFDPEAFAVETLLSRLSPRRVRVLLQPARASIDGAALERVLHRYEGDAEAREIWLKEDEFAFVHAKVILLKFRDRAVCLQGSANASRVALLRTANNGNVELCNLLSGTLDEFDHILDGLRIDTTTIDYRALSAEMDERDHTPEGTVPFTLLGGQLAGTTLHLSFRGPIPNANEVTLQIDERNILVVPDEASWNMGVLEVEVPSEELPNFDKVRPLRLSWGVQQSNPIFVLNQANITATFDEDRSYEVISKVGTLDLEDQELEELLAELNNTLVGTLQDIEEIERGRPLSPHGAAVTEQDDEIEDTGPRLAYGDIDFEALHRHHRLQAYRGHRREHVSRLQLILSSIAENYGKLHEFPQRDSAISTTGGPEQQTPDPTADPDGEIEDEEEVRQREEQREAEQERMARRHRKAFKRFLNRQIEGLENERFQDLAGPRVIATNYVILSHILLALAKKPWFDADHDYLLDTLIRLWEEFWGTPEQAGYYRQASPEQQSEIWKIVEEQHGLEQLIASVALLANFTSEDPSTRKRIQLRDTWRQMLENVPAKPDREVLENAAHTSGLVPIGRAHEPKYVLDHLEALARSETEEGFLRELEIRFGLPRQSSYLTRDGDKLTLEFSSDGALQDLNRAVMVLEHSMRFAEHRGDLPAQYRIVYKPEGARLAERQLIYSREPEEGKPYGQYLPVPPNSANIEAIDDVIKSVDKPVQPSLERWEKTLASWRYEANA